MNVAGDIQGVPLGVPKHDLELHLRSQSHPETHRRSLRNCVERCCPRQPGRRHQVAAVSALLVALVELRHRVVCHGEGAVVVNVQGDVGVVHAFVFHGVGQLQIEVYGAVDGGGGGIVGRVEGGNVEFLYGAIGFGGAEAEPQEESGEAGGDYEAAAASVAPAAAVIEFRHVSAGEISGSGNGEM